MSENIKLPTAKEFIWNYLNHIPDGTYDKCMIEFAKLHCQEQAKVIAEKTNWTGYTLTNVKIDKNLILNAYSLKTIK